MGELDEGERKTLRTDCIFRTDKYENGCSAVDAKELDCKTCSFYKNMEMQKKSLEKAERLYEKRLSKIPYTAPSREGYRRWTKEDDEWIDAHKGMSAKEMARHFGVSEASIWSRMSLIRKRKT